MIKKKIRYEGINGTIEEEFYFHLSKLDLLEMEAQHEAIGGIKGYYEKTMATKDSSKILDMIKWFIQTSYGERTPEGRHLKNSRIREEFIGSDAFSELFMELAQDPEKVNLFINGLVPRDLQEQIAKLGGNVQEDAPPPGPRPAVSNANVFEKESAPRPMESPLDRDEVAVPTESMMTPPAGALDAVPASRVLTKSEAEEMDAHELQAGLLDGRYKLS